MTTQSRTAVQPIRIEPPLPPQQFFFVAFRVGDLEQILLSGAFATELEALESLCYKNESNRKIVSFSVARDL